MNYKQIYNDLMAIPNRKTKDVDKYNKKLIKEKVDVSCLKDYILQYECLYRTYFQVSLGLLKTYQEQFEFIETHAPFLQEWHHVDMLTQFIKKPVSFEYAYEKGCQYVASDLPFLRRWGYVLFLMNLHKDYNNCVKILKLFKDDKKYYVQMAQAWLLADMGVYNFDLVYDFIKNSKLSYNILGKAIQKMCDSFRITEEQKQKVKDLRLLVRNN